MKKAQIWISAVLYMALGIIILVLVLSVGIPIINKIRDKNTATDTKDMMFKFDQNIRSVYNEGPGSRRALKIEVKKGNFKIDNLENTTSWTFETAVLLSEPGVVIKEGNLDMLSQETAQKGRYTTMMLLNYTNFLDLELENPATTFSGTKDIIMTNIGNNKILINAL